MYSTFGTKVLLFSRASVIDWSCMRGSTRSQRWAGDIAVLQPLDGHDIQTCEA